MLNSRLRRFAVAVLLLFIASGPLVAQQVQVTLDPVRTKIEWTLGATLHTVEGTFKLKGGAISFDPQTGNAGGEIVVDATSAQSGNNSRDSKMHKDVLESARYPEITFFPKHVTGKLNANGASNLQVQGVFHIHGADHDSTLSMSIQTGAGEVTATSGFSIPYQAWGMKNPSTLFLKVDNTVQMKVAAAGTMAVVGTVATAK